MKLKRITAVFLAVLTLFMITFSTTTFAAYSTNGFNYQRITSSYAEITGLTEGGEQESNAVVTIPSTLGGYSIVQIGQSAFFDNTTQEQFILPNSITTISSTAFYNATALKQINIPKNVTQIGQSAFNRCTSLETVTFSANNLQVLPSYVFYNCSSLDNVILPSSLNTIDEYAFANCISLTKIYIPASTSVISQNAFINVGDLTIYGVEGSTAQTFANHNGIPFISLDSKDTTSLNTWIIATKTKMESDMTVYIDSTVTNLQTEYDNAVAVYDDFFATQEEVDSAQSRLQTAYRALKLKAMLTLEEKLTIANTYIENADLYTEETIAQLQTSVDTATALVNSNNQKSATVNNAISDLDSKINALILKSKASLQTELEKANEIVNSEDTSIYTTVSFNRLKNAVENANTILADTNSTNENYLSALNTLTSALDKLTYQSYSDLAYVVSLSKSIAEGNPYKYTEESYNIFKTAYDNALPLLADGATPTNEQLTTANEELRQAYNSLKAVILGDINADGQITIKDTVLAQKSVIGKYEFSEREFYVADINSDGKISVVDVIMIQRILVGIA